MSYTIEKLNGCSSKIVFTFNELDLSQEVQLAVKDKQKTTNMKGFRKGKAPLAVVQKLYGPQIESDALNRFIQNEFYKVVTDEKLKLVGHPSIDNMKYDPGKSVSFDATVEVFPVVEIKDYSSYSFEREKAEVTQEEVDGVQKQMIESKAEMKALEQSDVALDKGHFAVLNFQGIQENGERPDNMRGEEFLLEIGSNQFINGFEEGMLGMKAGEERTLHLTFPADYHVPELQNSKVTFEVKLLEIKEKKFPEFNDEMAKEFRYDSVEDFQTKTRQNLQLQAERRVKEKLNQQILERLVTDNPFDVPPTLVRQQEEALMKDMTSNLKQRGFNDEMVSEYFEKWGQELTDKAVFQLRSGLILDKLARDLKIEASDSDLDAKIEETVRYSGLTKDQVKKYYTQNSEMKKNILYAIREEKTFERICQELKI